MKKFLFLFVVLISVLSCDKDEDSTPFYIRPDAKILIKPAQLDLYKSDSTHLSPLEIVKQTALTHFYNISTFGDQPVYGGGFNPEQRDTLSNPPCLKRWATDLINRDGNNNYYLVPDYIYATDLVFVRSLSGIADTIAYTPNAVMRQMESDIKAALANQDTTLAYEVFNNSFIFIPITGAEWRELKAQGAN